MKVDTARKILVLQEQADGAALAKAGQFNAWRERAGVALRLAMGEDHPLIARFEAVRYTPGMWTDRSPQSYFTDVRNGGIDRATDVIKAAIFELEQQASIEDPEPKVPAVPIDKELRIHVEPHVTAGRWDTAVREAVVFFEDWLRTRGGFGASDFGVDLAQAAFCANGPFVLGSTASEQEGWRLLARGFFGAVRNPANHRLTERADAALHAVSVLGAVSLLLTEIKATHPASQRDFHAA